MAIRLGPKTTVQKRDSGPPYSPGTYRSLLQETELTVSECSPTVDSYLLLSVGEDGPHYHPDSGTAFLQRLRGQQK
ncbi:hypothetical protein STEG23_019379 [Scotinomys teguina]